MLKWTPFLLLLLLFSGCGGQKSNTGVEQGIAPKSPLSYEDAVVKARTVAVITGSKYGEIAPTGSMEPILDSSSIPIYIDSDGSNITEGMVVVYSREGEPSVLHQVLAVTDTHFIPAGVANMRNDGRIERSRIKRILVGVIYTSGR
jgi:hypothetical protein